MSRRVRGAGAGVAGETPGAISAQNTAIELKRPTIVEVFPEQKDFAVRTFGMPGNPGYLGVCFGRVVTANSPAAHTSHAVNWQAVLWHEFLPCRHAPTHRQQNAALAQRGNLGL